VSDIEREFRLLSAAERRMRHLPGASLKVTRDREIWLFVDSALETMTFVEIAKACREKFGVESSPSKSSVYRYWLATLRARSPDLPRLPSANSLRGPKNLKCK